jgi:hypothetical protein
MNEDAINALGNKPLQPMMAEISQVPAAPNPLPPCSAIPIAIFVWFSNYNCRHHPYTGYWQSRHARAREHALNMRMLQINDMQQLTDYLAKMGRENNGGELRGVSGHSRGTHSCVALATDLEPLW